MNFDTQYNENGQNLRTGNIYNRLHIAKIIAVKSLKLKIVVINFCVKLHSWSAGLSFQMKHVFCIVYVTG